MPNTGQPSFGLQRHGLAGVVTVAVCQADRRRPARARAPIVGARRAAEEEGGCRSACRRPCRAGTTMSEPGKRCHRRVLSSASSLSIEGPSGPSANLSVRGDAASFQSSWRSLPRSLDGHGSHGLARDALLAAVPFAAVAALLSFGEYLEAARGCRGRPAGAPLGRLPPTCVVSWPRGRRRRTRQPCRPWDARLSSAVLRSSR